MPSTKIIRQKNLVDCAICCMSMATGIPYQSIKMDADIYAKIHYPGKKFSGMSYEMEQSILWKHGIKFSFKEAVSEIFFDDGFWKKRVIYKAINAKKIVGKNKALLSCPSLNFKDKYHALYWDGKRLYDPSNLKRYTKKKAFETAVAVTVLK